VLGTLRSLEKALEKVFMSNARLAWIDGLKGIGILSVVAGHIYGGVLGKMIFLFHMPLFFVIGGLLYRPPAPETNFLKQKAIHLLIPYATFLLLLSAKDLVAASVQILKSPGSETLFHLLKIIGTALYGGRLLQGWTGVFWFVTCFFLTQQAFHWLQPRCNAKGWGVIGAIALCLSSINSQFFPQVAFPWNINVVLAALPFFAAGFYLKQIQFRTLTYGIYSLFIPLSLLLVTRGFPIAYNMKGSSYGIPVLTPVLAMGCIVGLMGISQLIAHRMPFLQTGLAYLGSASMMIMYLHQPVQLTLKKFGVDSEIRLFVATLVPLIIFFLVKERSFVRALFLGSPKDFEKLFHS
jgi:polysaccharide biosynthesis protein PslL